MHSCNEQACASIVMSIKTIGSWKRKLLQIELKCFNYEKYIVGHKIKPLTNTKIIYKLGLSLIQQYRKYIFITTYFISCGISLSPCENLIYQKSVQANNFHGP